MTRGTAPSADRTAGAAQDGADGAGTSIGTAVAVPILLLLVAIATIVSSLGLGYWTPIGPGPGFFPLWLAVLLGALSVVWLVQRLRARSAPPEPPEEPDTPEGQAMELLHEEPQSLTKIVPVLGSLIAVAALLEVLGFQLSILLFLLFQLKVLARRGWVLAVVVAVLGSFGVFTAFTELLSVNLPTSSIPLLRSMGL